MVPRLIRAIHALVAQLEKRNCRLVRGNGQFAHLSVAQGNDRLTVHWREALEEFEREPTIEEKRKPSVL
jgi:DNA invertase Pin-like site-specific DNA recombinase